LDDEASTSPLVKEKLFAARSKDAVRSRSLSGKPARLLRTAWTLVREGTACASAELELASGEERTLVLFLARVPHGASLAVREVWRLAPLSGEIRAGDDVFPAAGVRVAAYEVTRVSGDLPREIVSPDAFAAYVEANDFDAREAIRRVVLVPREEHPTLLARLEPIAARLEREDPARAGALAPAFAWLASGDDGRAASWEALLPAEPERPAPPRARLDLPFPDRSE